MSNNRTIWVGVLTLITTALISIAAIVITAGKASADPNYTKMVNGVQVDMTFDEIAQRKAEELQAQVNIQRQAQQQSAPPSIQALFLMLPIDLQNKYESTLMFGDLWLQRGNLTQVHRVFANAWKIADLTNPTEASLMQQVRSYLLQAGVDTSDIK